MSEMQKLVIFHVGVKFFRTITFLTYFVYEGILQLYKVLL